MASVHRNHVLFDISFPCNYLITRNKNYYGFIPKNYKDAIEVVEVRTNVVRIWKQEWVCVVEKVSLEYLHCGAEC